MLLLLNEGVPRLTNPRTADNHNKLAKGFPPLISRRKPFENHRYIQTATDN